MNVIIVLALIALFVIVIGLLVSKFPADRYTEHQFDLTLNDKCDILDGMKGQQEVELRCRDQTIRGTVGSVNLEDYTVTIYDADIDHEEGTTRHTFPIRVELDEILVILERRKAA